MRKIIWTVVSAFAFTGAVNALETDVAPKVTDIQNHQPSTALYVGNSYSFYNCGVHGYVRGFAKESKTPWKARLQTISSGKLSFHNVQEYLTPHEGDPYVKESKDGKTPPMFDVVLLQALSTEPINPKLVPNFKKYLRQHIETVREHGSTPIVVMTWARQDKPEQTRQLANATIEAANANDAIVLPVGLAFAESLKKRPDLILHQKDKSHPTAAGSYLYGAMIYGLLFKKSPEGFKFLGECERPLKPADAKYLQQVVWNVLKEFYGWKD